MALSKPKLVVFDLDGTLVHFPFNHLFTTAKQVLDELGFGGVKRAELEQGFAEFQFFRVVEPEVREVFASRLAAALKWEEYPRPELFSYTVGCLARLRQAGFKLALATSRDSPPAALEQELQQIGLREHFEVIAVRHVESTDWSDKGPQLQEISLQTAVPLGNILMVGDNPRDISSAKGVGVGLTAALESGGIKREILALEQPAWLCATLVELTDCVLSI